MSWYQIIHLVTKSSLNLKPTRKEFTMRKTAIILTLVMVFGLASIVAAQQTTSTFNPIGKEGKVLSVVAKYGLSPTSDTFIGGDASYIEVVAAYPKTGTLTKKNLNTVINSDKIPDTWEIITIRVPAFKFKNPTQFLCYQQFKTLHHRLKNRAQTIRIEWMTPSAGSRYTPVVRVKYDGSDTIKVYPSRLTIVRTRTAVPGR